MALLPGVLEGGGVAGELDLGEVIHGEVGISGHVPRDAEEGGQLQLLENSVANSDLLPNFKNTT